MQADLTTREGNRQAIDAALEAHGRIDVLVPIAGVQHVARSPSSPRTAGTSSRRCC